MWFEVGKWGLCAQNTELAEALRLLRREMDELTGDHERATAAARATAAELGALHTEMWGLEPPSDFFHLAPSSLPQG